VTGKGDANGSHRACACDVPGYPAPELRWYHIIQGQTAQEQVIDDDKHYIHQLLSHGQVLSMVEIWFQMTIINVQANDYGIYVCEGSNSLGSDRVHIDVYGQFSRVLFCLVVDCYTL